MDPTNNGDDSPTAPRPSPEQIEWTIAPPLSEQLPFRFENGMAFEGFDPQCSGCGGAIADEDLRGAMVPLEDGNECLLLARGYCRSCDGIVSYSFRLFAEDGLRVEPFVERAAEGLPS